ncbi:MAG: RHS repeat-associated core domain-containing protein [Actinobacteria bacterium]|nr:RHS repeat-associated core domain-containing protein [Actinomycetota bacterium]
MTQTTDGVTTAYATNPDGSVASATTGPTSTVYGYDPQGRRTSATTATGGTASQATTWAYDTRGRASAVNTTGTGGSAAEGRVYDGDGLLTQLRVTDAAGAVSVYEYSWDRTRGVPQIVDSKINNWTWVRSDIANERTDYKQNFYPNWYKYDELGSAIQSPGNTNAADAPAGYDPWGNPASTPAGSTWFGYRGELTIGDTLYLRNRDYDPTTGTFLTPDPLDGINGTTTLTNAYHYTNNDPLDRIDPLGLRPTDDEIGRTDVNGPTIPGGERSRGTCTDFQFGLIDAYTRAQKGPPCGFQDWAEAGRRRGYLPEYLRSVSAGPSVAINGEGDCSFKLGTLAGIVVDQITQGPVGNPLMSGSIAESAGEAFGDACASHDYGYDLLRFAKRRLRFRSIVAGRRKVDSILNAMMGSVCGDTGWIGIEWNKKYCQDARRVISRGVATWTAIEGNGLD